LLVTGIIGCIFFPKNVNDNQQFLLNRRVRFHFLGERTIFWLQMPITFEVDKQ